MFRGSKDYIRSFLYGDNESHHNHNKRRRTTMNGAAETNDDDGYEVVEPDGTPVGCNSSANVGEGADDGWEAVTPVTTQTSPTEPNSTGEDIEMMTTGDADSKPAATESSVPSVSPTASKPPSSTDCQHSTLFTSLHTTDGLLKAYVGASNKEFRQEKDAVWNNPTANVQSDAAHRLHAIQQAVLSRIYQEIVGEANTATRNVEEVRTDIMKERINVDVFYEILITYYNQSNGGFVYSQHGPDGEDTSDADNDKSGDYNRTNSGSPTTTIVDPSSVELFKEWTTSGIIEDAIDKVKIEYKKNLSQAHPQGPQQMKQLKNGHYQNSEAIVSNVHRQASIATSSLGEVTASVAPLQANSCKRPALKRHITPETTTKMKSSPQLMTGLEAAQPTASETNLSLGDANCNGDPEPLDRGTQSQSMNSGARLVNSLTTVLSEGISNNAGISTGTSENMKGAPIELKSEKLERQLNWLLDCHDKLVELTSSGSQQQHSGTVKYAVDVTMNALREYGMTLHEVCPSADDLVGFPAYIPNKRRRHGVSNFGDERRNGDPCGHPVQVSSASLVAPPPVASSTGHMAEEMPSVTRCATSVSETKKTTNAQHDPKALERVVSSEPFSVGTADVSSEKKDLVEQTETSIKKLSIEDDVIQESHMNEARTFNAVPSEDGKKSQWIDECEVNDYDTVINHTRRRSKPGQQAWMEARGRRRVIREDEAIALRKQFESTPIMSEDRSKSYYPRIFYRIKDSAKNEYLYRNATLDEIRHNVSAKRATPKGHKLSSPSSGNNTSQTLPKKRKADMVPPAASHVMSNSHLCGVTLREIISGYYGLLRDLEKRSGARLSGHAQTFRKTLDSNLTVPHVDQAPETMDGFSLQNYMNIVDGMRRLWSELLRSLSAGPGIGSLGFAVANPPSVTSNIPVGGSRPFHSGIGCVGTYDCLQSKVPNVNAAATDNCGDEADKVKIAAESLSQLGGSPKR